MTKRIFYHYTKFIKEIKRDKWLLATSFARTYTYDWVLERCPEELLNGKEITKFKAYQRQNKEIIKIYKREQEEDKNYESCYRDLKLNFKNELLSEFFNNDGYVLAFSQKFEPGWAGESSRETVSSIYKKTGNEYVKFRITDDIARRCYVLEQKYWKEDYYEPILAKKFGKNWERLEKMGKRWKDYLKFKKYFAKLLFADYYKSIVRLDDYKWNFMVPEFWIGADIPVSMCKFGKVSFKELKKHAGVSKKDILSRKMTVADISERKKRLSRSSIARLGRK